MNTNLYQTTTRGPFEIDLKRGKITYSVLEQWAPAGHSIQISCKTSGILTRTITTGFERAELDQLQSSISSSLGIKSLVEIGSSIQQTTSLTLKLSQGQSVTTSANCPAPGCGIKTYALYFVVRQHTFVIEHKRWFGRRVQLPPIRLEEKTEQYLVYESHDESFPNCPCPEPKEDEEQVAVSIEIGKLFWMKTAVRKGGKLFLELWGNAIEMDLVPIEDKAYEVKVSGCSKQFPELTEITGDAATVKVRIIRDFEMSDLAVVNEGAYADLSA